MSGVSLTQAHALLSSALATGKDVHLPVVTQVGEPHWSRASWMRSELGSNV